MNFLLWVIAIALVYVAAARSVFVVIDAFRRRQYALIALVPFGLLVADFITEFWVAFLRIDNFYKAPDAVGLISCCIILIVFLQLAALGDNKLTWQDKKRRKELSRQIKLHMALATGAIVFSVPFYWLVTTSLKPDVRTNQFPPDLIPMQQSSVKINDQDHMVFLSKHGRVAKAAELEGDKWQVMPLLPRRDGSLPRSSIAVLGQDGKPRAITEGIVVPSSDLKPDLHPVLVWKNYSDALAFLPPEYNHGLRPLWNTIYVTLLVIIGTVLSSSLVAFSFARLKWPGRDVLFVILIATMMIPPAVTMLPVFLIFRSLNWIDTLRPLWFPAIFGSAFNVFLLRQFFLTIPNDLEDAAKIDGASYFTIYWKIMLPLIKPALAAITIFAFMGSWNNFMGPLIYISSPEKMTLAYALQLFQGMHGGEPAMMMAAATLVMLPVLGVFFFTQRYMIQGVTLTGIKG